MMYVAGTLFVLAFTVVAFVIAFADDILDSAHRHKDSLPNGHR